MSRTIGADGAGAGGVGAVGAGAGGVCVDEAAAEGVDVGGVGTGDVSTGSFVVAGELPLECKGNRRRAEGLKFRTRSGCVAANPLGAGFGGKGGSLAIDSILAFFCGVRPSRASSSAGKSAVNDSDRIGLGGCLGPMSRSQGSGTLPGSPP